MAYIGNQLAQSYISLAKQDFTTSATTAYTLDYPVANENEIALFINFVRQEPTTAYTASGTSLTLSSATSASDDMYAIFIGKAVQTVTPPDGSVTSAKLSYPLTTFSSTGIDDNATSTAITIDSSERVGINETSPEQKLHITSGGTTYMRVENTTLSCVTDFGTSGTGSTIINRSAHPIQFWTDTTERMRIDSSGNLLVGTTSSDVVVADAEGISIQADASIQANTSGSTIPCRIGRLGTDGTLIEFRAQTLVEGSISVSGATVAYNGFTGTHWSRFTDNSTPTILKGTVLESLDEMCDWYNLEFDVTTQDEDGNDVTTTKKVPYVLQDSQSVGDVITYNHEGTDVQATIIKEADIKHVKSKVSDTVDAKNVYGVFSAYDEDGEGYNDFYVASVGTFVVRIKQGETVAKGDLLQSNGDGTAKVQTDDAIRASTFAKVLSTTIIETYEDGSYLVPCSLMC